MKPFEEQFAESIITATNVDNKDANTIASIMHKLSTYMYTDNSSNGISTQELTSKSQNTVNKQQTKQNLSTRKENIEVEAPMLSETNCEFISKTYGKTLQSAEKIPKSTLPSVRRTNFANYPSLSDRELYMPKSVLKGKGKQSFKKKSVSVPAAEVEISNCNVTLSAESGYCVSHDLPMKLPTFEQVELQKNLYFGPTDESNWVIPGSFLVGAYPASNYEMLHGLVIQSILKQGITTFVCLQEEYVHTGVTPAMWESGEYIRPYIYDAYELCKSQESMLQRRKKVNCRKFVASEKLEFLHLPIVDCKCTTDTAICNIAKEICWKLIKGEIVYLHCWGGHGRTGTVVAIVLAFLYGISATEALRRTQLYHDIRRAKLKVRSPQTDQQRRQVRRILCRWKSTSESHFLTRTSVILPYESKDVSQFALAITKKQKLHFSAIRKKCRLEHLEREKGTISSDMSTECIEHSTSTTDIKDKTSKNEVRPPKKPNTNRKSSKIFQKARRLVPQKRTRSNTGELTKDLVNSVFTKSGKLGWLTRNTKVSSDSSETIPSDDSMENCDENLELEDVNVKQSDMIVHRPLKPPNHKHITPVRRKNGQQMAIR